MFDLALRRVRADTGPRLALVVAASALVVAAIACDENTPTGVVAPPVTAAVTPCPILGCPKPAPAWYSNFSSAVSVARYGNTMVLRSNGVPDHKSPYFCPVPHVGPCLNPKYIANPDPGFVQNPNAIKPQSFNFRIPAIPAVTGGYAPTAFGPIGIALNGVPFYNQYSAPPAVPVAGEAPSFDQYNGHPQADSIYHYHWEPLWLTKKSRAALVGVLLDGFPVYGPKEGGAFVKPWALDLAHGHFGATPEFPLGVYHYHTTAAPPYINGSGYAGTPGTVTY